MWNCENTVERAFQLARSGEFRDVGAIRAQLLREQHELVDNHLAGRLIRRQLSGLCSAARASEPTVSAA